MALQFFRTRLGEPDRIRAEAQVLRARAEAMREAAARLQEVTTKGVWDAPSGVTFASRVGEVPTTLGRLATTLEDTAGVIVPYADLLAESQRVMEIAREDYERYDTQAHWLEVRLASMSSTDPEYVRVDRQWRDACDAREFAKRRHQREGEQATMDEECVARRLADIGQVSSDPWAYDLFEGLSSLGRSGAVDNVATDFVPALRPIALLQFADPIGMLGLRALYGQGSYTGVGKATKQTLLTVAKVPVGPGARLDDAARRSSRAAETAAAKARRAGPVVAPGRGVKRLRHRAGTAVRQTSAGAVVRAKHGARDAFDNATGIRMVTNMTSDWAAIAGAGHVTKGVHVLKYSVAAADAVDGTVRTARTTGEKIAVATREDRRKSVAPTPGR